MSQSKGRKKTQMPTYSAESMMVRFVGGLSLMALGVLMFLALLGVFQGNVFDGARKITSGLGGAFAFFVPVWPIWGGALLALSSRKKAPIRPFLLGFGAFLLLSAILTELTFTAMNGANVSVMDSLRMKTNGLGGYLQEAFALGIRGIGGGAMGMLLAWPVWRLIGAIPGAVLLILGLLVVLFFLFHVDVKAIGERMQAKKAERIQKQEAEQEKLRQQELAWRQQMHQQEYMSQQAWQEAQRRNVYAQPPAQAQREQASPAQTPAPWPGRAGQNTSGFAPMPGEHYVEATPDTPYDEEIPKPKKKEKRKSFFGKKNQPASEPESKAAETVVPSQQQFPFAAHQQNPQPTQDPDSRPSGKTISSFGDAVEARGMRFSGGTWRREENFAEETPVRREVEQVSVSTQAATRDIHLQTANQVQGSIFDDGRLQNNQHTPSVQEEAPYIPQPVVQGKQTTWAEAAKAKLEAAKQEANGSVPSVPVVKQQPKPSWTDDVPWETEEDDGEGYGAVPIPKVQTKAPKDAWQPELKLPLRRNPEDSMEEEAEKVEIPPYVYPPMSLLRPAEISETDYAEDDERISTILVETLKSFKIPARVVHVTHGPCISRFELEIAAGIRVSRVMELDRNIAMDIAVPQVRIEAPIPGKSLVGVEIPNKKRSAVTLREVLESKAMQDLTSPMGVAIGKNLEGKSIVCDIEKLPHLLVAGTTGSGKSVCINTIINSILFRASPREVRMIMIDPKMVELQGYNGIPHLLIPVVSDVHKAAGALEWAVAEMMERYNKFAERGVKELKTYNNSLAEGEEPMPRILIVIDELADLMMVCKKDVEERIGRLAQLARACGIHLLVATQRPSADIITGYIRSNIAPRIAFKVSKNQDSRIILDVGGAEKLLGHGDMLFMPAGEDTMVRVQGCYQTEEDVAKVVNFIRQHNPSTYDGNLLERMDKAKAQNSAAPDDVVMMEDEEGEDPLLMEAIDMTVRDKQVSASLLQRRLRVGYARAGRLVDEMEARGIVSPKEGAKPRKCLITMEEYLQMKDNDLI